jgi:hypothetical protein
MFAHQPTQVSWESFIIEWFSSVVSIGRIDRFWFEVAVFPHFAVTLSPCLQFLGSLQQPASAGLVCRQILLWNSRNVGSELLQVYEAFQKGAVQVMFDARAVDDRALRHPTEKVGLARGRVERGLQSRVHLRLSGPIAPAVNDQR